MKNIIIRDNLSLNHGKLEYTLQKPFESIFYSNKSLKCGHCIDSILKAVYERVMVMKSVVKRDLNQNYSF